MPPPFKPNTDLDPNVLYRDSSGTSPSNTQEEERQNAAANLQKVALSLAPATGGFSMYIPAANRAWEAMTEGGKFQGIRAGLSGVGSYLGDIGQSVARDARELGRGMQYIWSGEEKPQQPPTNLIVNQPEPPYAPEEVSPINAYRNQLARIARGGSAGVESQALRTISATSSAPPPPPPPPPGMSLYPQGIRFQPASRGASLADSTGRIVSSGGGTAQVGGRSIMGDYVDTVRSGLLAQDATARAQQLGDTPEGRAYAEMARAHDEAYQSAKQAFASKYGPNASNIFQQASQQLRSRGITPEQLMSGAADRMTENVVFPQYGEVLPGMGVATDAQGRIVRSVTGAPSGAPQTVYTPTAQGIQASSLVPRQTLMDPGLAAYLGASQITPEAARITAAGLPAMQSALTKRERAQLQQQQIARADLTKAREAARSQYGLEGLAPPPLEQRRFTDKTLAEGATLLGELSTLQSQREDPDISPQVRQTAEQRMTIINARLSKLGYERDPTTGIWGLPSAGGTPKGLGASTEQLKPGAVGSKGYVNMGKERREFLSKYAAAMQKAPEVAPEPSSEAETGRKIEMDNLKKQGARLGVLFDDKGAAREMTADDLPKAATKGMKADEATQDAYLRFYGTSAAASKALKAAGYSDEA